MVDDGATQLDADVFVYNATGPTLLEFTTDGIGGLSAGLRIEPGEEQPELDDNAWGPIRHGSHVRRRRWPGLPPQSGPIPSPRQRQSHLPDWPARRWRRAMLFQSGPQARTANPDRAYAGHRGSGHLWGSAILFRGSERRGGILFAALTEINAEGEPTDVANQVGALVYNLAGGVQQQQPHRQLGRFRGSRCAGGAGFGSGHRDTCG